MRFQKAKWPVLLLVACIRGAFSRVRRRALGMPPRVVRGTYPMHMVPSGVKVDRVAGFPSKSVVVHTKLAAYKLVASEDFDVVLSERGLAWDEVHWAAACHLARDADVWVSYFDSRFGPSNKPASTDRFLALLKALGIRLIVSSNGLDSIHLAGPATRYGWVEAVARDYPDWDLASDTPHTLARLASFTRRANFVLGLDYPTAALLPRIDLVWNNFTVDLAGVEPRVSTGNTLPAVLHAPNHKNCKATNVLMKALDRVREAGIPFVFRMVEKTPRPDALRLYQEADVIAADFCIGTVNNLALEGLGLGKPVVQYQSLETLADPAFNLPIVNGTQEALAEVLACLLASRRLRERVGDASLAAFRKYRSLEAMADVWRRIIWHVWDGTPLNLLETLEFSPERKPRTLCEDPWEPEFWPVPVDDLLPSIREAIESVRAIGTPPEVPAAVPAQEAGVPPVSATKIRA